MDCFSGFWVRRLEENQENLPWHITGIEFPKIFPIQYLNTKTDALVHTKSNDIMANKNSTSAKSSSLYCDCRNCREMAEGAPNVENNSNCSKENEGRNTQEPLNSKPRQRRTGVYELSARDDTIFNSVKQLRDKYQEMLEQTNRHLTQGNLPALPGNLRRSNSMDGYLVPPPSGYCSSGTSDDERERNWRHLEVKRCGSSDSAVGQSDEEITHMNPQWTDGEPQNNPTCVPSKTLIEAQYVPYPTSRKLSDCVSDNGEFDESDSRRQSCYTDDGDEQSRYRYWRTPSVVVSDYSDDIIGLTLDDIEYFRNQRKDCSSPDSSLHSSCSNLNYCGSTISSLESDFIKLPYRKESDCSLCSTCSGDEDDSSPIPTTKKRHSRTMPTFPNASENPLHQPQTNSKLIMETLLAVKMENAALRKTARSFLRSDSVDSSTSVGSLNSTSSEYCRCDDCLLGIADLYAQCKDDLFKNRKPSGWRKLRNIVQWTPFFQTYKKQRYPWVQLAGHQGNFKAGPDQGTILKKLCEKEEKCFKILMKDLLRPYIPEYKGLVTSDDGECSYIQLQDLLGDFQSPCVMDCKIGVRTYLEEELAKAKEKPKLRKDMFEKMCQIDPNAPTEEEHRLKGVTKPRYMVWRETISSTETLGFRIEGIRKGDGTSSKDFKTTKTRENVLRAFIDFTEGFPHAVPKYIQRLKAIKATLEASEFFLNHEVIGSSLLFVHDRFSANIWLIDFAKTIFLPDNIKINHSSKWKVGNHEDGYLIGIDNIISIFVTIMEQQSLSMAPPLILCPEKES